MSETILSSSPGVGPRHFSSSESLDSFAKLKKSIQFALQETEDPTEGIENQMKPMHHLARNYADVVASQIAADIIDGTKDIAGLNFELHPDFPDLIKDMFKLPGIKRALATAHPYYWALLKYPKEDLAFYNRVIEVKSDGIVVKRSQYLIENWDQKIHDDYLSQQAIKDSQPILANKKIKQPKRIKKSATPMEVRPISVQLSDENINGADRLYKFFFHDFGVANLSADTWVKEMTGNDVVGFVKSINLHYSWNRDVRSDILHLRCNRGKQWYTPINRTCKINCPAMVTIRSRPFRKKKEAFKEGNFIVEYKWKHLHSFLDADHTKSPKIRCDVRENLLKCSDLELPWSSVEAKLKKLQFGVSVSQLTGGTYINSQTSKDVLSMSPLITPQFEDIDALINSDTQEQLITEPVEQEEDTNIIAEIVTLKNDIRTMLERQKEVLKEALKKIEKNIQDLEKIPIVSEKQVAENLRIRLRKESDYFYGIRRACLGQGNETTQLKIKRSKSSSKSTPSG
ncbi:uncharacterized protein J8A68_005042 [[Candida] subhashii]|uniref:Uncharacterized protein n=1 Tax=[Candida] subhashii TaxID=561895 RepID=A0A8J5QG63_9ASCO|nr:uncharacterized protein J8A68_005042 [[Candida] subhashii]KAG7661464.1 hypothetical protein J8A68_005042 [[Candida] subhashii]